MPKGLDLLALLQQQQDAVKPPVPPPPSDFDVLGSALSRVGDAKAKDPRQAFADIIPAPPPPDLRAQLGARMPTTQTVREKPIRGGGISLPSLGDIFGKHEFGDEGTLLGAMIGEGPQPEVGTPVGPRPFERQAQAPAGDAEQEGGGESSLLQRLNEEKMQSAQGFGAVLPPGIDDAVQDAVSKYGIAQADHQKAIESLRVEFEGTPEIDQAIAATHQALAEAKSNRRQPSAWDFMAMALMNLSGMNPRVTADMILGLGDQERREARLEDQLFGLQQQQAGARMQGRRDLRGMQMAQQDQQARLQQLLQKEAMEESRFSREMDFKERSKMTDLLRGLAGQEAETERAGVDQSARKSAADRRQKILRALQLEQLLNQGQQAPPRDNRQSRMFGNIVGSNFA